MGSRWVYRRPFFRANRPKIPLTRGGIVHVLRRRRALVQRRRAYHRRIIYVFGVAAAQAVSMPNVVRRRIRIKQPYTQKVHRAPAPGGRFEGKQGPIIRMLQAVGRMRRKTQQRLRFRPRPEEVPPSQVEPTVKAVSRGEIQTAGAEEAHIYVAGAKRGEVQ